MKLKTLLSQINKAIADGTLNENSLVTITLPTSYHRVEGMLMPERAFAVKATATMLHSMSDDSPSEICFEPHIPNYRRVMAEDFGKQIPIVA